MNIQNKKQNLNKFLKLLCVMIISLIVSSNFVYADQLRTQYATKNMKGQDYYLNRCSSCHGDGARGGNMASIREWKALFLKNASELIELHLDDESTLNIVKYFNEKEFAKESGLMLDLMQEFAYDSDNIPTCN